MKIVVLVPITNSEVLVPRLIGVPLMVTGGPPGTMVLPSTTIAVVALTVAVPNVDGASEVGTEAERLEVVAVGNEDTAVEIGAAVDVEGLGSG